MVLKAVRARSARPFVIATVAGLAAVFSATTVGGGWASAQENGTDGTAPTPTASVNAETNITAEADLTRRGLHGKVVRKGNTSFVMETRFGRIHVLVNEETQVFMPPDGQVRFDSLEIGDRVGVLLVRVEEDDTSAADPSEAGPDPVMRTATALKIVIVPDRATRRHIRGVVLENVRDRLRIIDERGREREIDVDVNVDVDVEREVGAELLLIAREEADGLRLRLRAAADAEAIEKRLARISERREEIKEKVDEVRERVADQRAEIIDRVKENLDEVEVDAAAKARIRAAANDLKVRIEANIEKVREDIKERQEKREQNTAPTRDQNSERNNGVKDREPNEGKSEREAEATKTAAQKNEREAEATRTAVGVSVTVDGKLEAGSEGVRR